LAAPGLSSSHENWADPPVAVRPDQLVSADVRHGRPGMPGHTGIFKDFAADEFLVGISEQGQYGEGMVDSVALPMTGDARVGVGYSDTDCTNVRRDARDPVCQYDPVNCTTNCGDATDTHGCGRLLSCIVWDLRETLRTTHPDDFQDIPLANQMGGELRATTDGPGCGASFTLSLPEPISSGRQAA
jgi:hypothetical protein